MVAAVISAANELNQVRQHACVSAAHACPTIGQASKSDSSHPVPAMLLALHTRILQDDRWLVRKLYILCSLH